MTWIICEPVESGQDGFEGRNTTRKNAVNSLVDFLMNRRADGIFHVYGISGIGKTFVITQARTEAGNSKNGPAIHEITNGGPSSLTPKALIDVLLTTFPKVEKEVTVSRFEGETLGRILDHLAWKTSEVVGSGIDTILLRWNADSESEIHQDVTNRLFATRSGMLAMKLVVESRGEPPDSPPHVGSSSLIRPYIEPEPVPITRFSPTECRTYIEKRIRTDVDQEVGSELRSALVLQVLHWAGSHPGLLASVTSLVKDLNGYTTHTAIQDYVRERIDSNKRGCRRRVSSITASLSSEAIGEIQNGNIHGQCQDGGLRCASCEEEHLAELIVRFAKIAHTNPIMAHDQPASNGGSTMVTDLSSIIAGYAIKRAMDSGLNSLKKLWLEVFPPTPIYVASLERAAKVIGEEWKKEHGCTPRLNLADATFRPDIDLARIDNLPSGTDDTIEELLRDKVTGDCSDDDKARFARRVLQEANESFVKAIKFGHPEASQLWKPFVVTVAEQNHKEVKDTLDSLAARFEILSTQLLCHNTQTISTIYETLGPEGYLGGEKVEAYGLSWPNRQGSLSIITRVEFLDRWKTEFRYWTLARRKVQRLERKEFDAEEEYTQTGDEDPAQLVELNRVKAALARERGNLIDKKAVLLELANMAPEILQ